GLVSPAGGQSQLDIWAPKPSAPEEVRGAFRPIRTAVPGLHVCEHLPRVARLAGLFTVARSASHEDLDHGSACYLALTGHYRPRRSSNPPPRPTDQPTLGAVLHRARPSPRFPYPAAHANGPLPAPRGASPRPGGGLLGRARRP